MGVPRDSSPELIVRGVHRCDNIQDTSAVRNWVCLGVTVLLGCQLIARGVPGCDINGGVSRWT